MIRAGGTLRKDCLLLLLLLVQRTFSRLTSDFSASLKGALVCSQAPNSKPS